MRAFLAVTIGLLVVSLGAVFALGRSVELVAITSVPIGAALTIDPASTQTIAVVQQGERVAVLACKDLKHYIVPEVRLQDGRVGYVIGGQFEIVRSAASIGKPLVFSCS
ncbi:MAG: hypothetical protein O9343_08030 [Burkholderiaceae bacterium]|jgi:hypothetical protein|nr:hypothetical protein [Burkholderiaceae bacterium]